MNNIFYVWNLSQFYPVLGLLCCCIQPLAGRILALYFFQSALFTKGPLTLSAASIQHQHCGDTSHTSLIEYNGVTPKWVVTPFRSDSIIFNQRTVASIIRSIDADAQCKWTLNCRVKFSQNLLFTVTPLGSHLFLRSNN